jgi:hypothetical protein
MAINPAFFGHGIFLQLEPINGLRRYANYKTPLPPNPTVAQLVDKFVQAITDMHMSSVWFELFTRTGELDPDGKQGTQELVDGLRAAKIHAIPWGYCWGTNSQYPNPNDNDLHRAIGLCNKYKLDCFVADIEPGNKLDDGTEDKWDADALKGLLVGLNANFGNDNLGISSFASLDDNVQSDARKLLPPVTGLVSFCAPQIYWNARDPVPYAAQSLQSWRNAGVTTELVATVQSYWGTAKGTLQVDMEAKVKGFATTNPDSEWSKIIGLNWYHAGWNDNTVEGAMSNKMIADISGVNLDRKPYKKV